MNCHEEFGVTIFILKNDGYYQILSQQQKNQWFFKKTVLITIITSKIFLRNMLFYLFDAKSKRSTFKIQIQFLFSLKTVFLSFFLLFPLFKNQSNCHLDEFTKIYSISYVSLEKSRMRIEFVAERRFLDFFLWFDRLWAQQNTEIDNDRSFKVKFTKQNASISLVILL